MTRWFSRMGVRERLLLAVLATTGIALVTMTVVFNLVLSSGLASDVDKRLQAITVDTSRTIQVSGGQVSLPRSSADTAQLGALVWVFINGMTFTAPAVDPAISDAAHSLDGGDARFLDITEQEVRLYGVPLMDRRHPPGDDRRRAIHDLVLADSEDHAHRHRRLHGGAPHHRGVCGELGPQCRLQAGGEDDDGGGGMEHRRPGSPLRPGRAP